MLFEIENSKKEIFADLCHELQRGALDRKHPFRFVVLSSSAGAGVDSRYVVVRKVEKDLQFFFFTDVRSTKINQLRKNPNVSLLFYHPQKRTQIRINGHALLHHQNDLAKNLWRKVQNEAQKSYNSKLAPGAEISDPHDAFYWQEDLSDSENFCVIQIHPEQIEALQLNGLEHLRIYFERVNSVWEGKWLVP
ncbi:Pyridoxamine 5'-phosphate oxidase-related, FMN-binding protein [Indibacter alkaliphilus LW1]|uniref:Pyridoxamine 5'-phosphate oxidase-related, FMN-binding protein n=1 Tax=Indibacter alkaliphilus (strain CCUG 57479 / KCTC 22604 / LW1) TaxID=1189612 RepID=S2CZ47_INDAL|nr:pyridoxamine 5'-phosphate oxidase family protein [Indibacter alkaliphilus]EOZ92427.1 Pyridoxamine 5'-phosphate oxidase-related, FMN-binding protein [Indibacter alkaliphilus LW1]